MEVLVERLFPNFKKASKILGEPFYGTGQGHSDKTSRGEKSHLTAVEAAMSFIVLENRALADDTQLRLIAQ